MVAIHGRALLRRAISIVRRHYNRCFTNLSHARGGPTILGPSSSFVHGNTNTPSPNVAPAPPKTTHTHVAPNGQIPKGRKQGRVKRKRYNQLARHNSTLSVPVGFPDDPLEKTILRQISKHKRKGGRKRDDRDSEAADNAQAGGTLRDQYKLLTNHGTTNEHDAFVMSELESLIFDKDRREGEFDMKEVSERVKGQAAVRKARLRKETDRAERLRKVEVKKAAEAERLRELEELEKREERERLLKMEELERREEKERADRWKDQRLAQLEREKVAAVDELAREKAGRMHSKLQRVFKDREQRHREEEYRKQGRYLKLAVDHEVGLLCDNAILKKRLREADDVIQQACNQRDHVAQEVEEEKTRRLRVEESLHRWKELVKAHFPGGQQQQNPGQHVQQEQPQEQLQEQPEPEQHPPLEDQFELYEKKWQLLRSGVDIDGSAVHLIFFSQIPWPVINMIPTHPSQIQPQNILEFFTHPLHEEPNAKKRSRKTRDELKRWHPDRFNMTILPKVHEEDKAAVVEAVRMVAHVLTDLLY